MDIINSLYWIGVRESEINNTNGLFKGSITTYGSNKNGNYSFDKFYKYRFDCNSDNEKWIDFINQNCKKIIANDINAKFMLYYSPEYVDLDDEIQERIICNNNELIIEFLNNKIISRIWAAEFVDVVPFLILSKDKISYKSLLKRFPSQYSFVIQQCESSGGSGTLYVNKDNFKNTINNLSSNKTYSVSPYIGKSISINVHLVIYEDEVVFFPPSIQIIKNTDNHLSYIGNDFEAYNGLLDKIKKQIHDFSIKIGENLKKIGYLGVCGIDYIATKENVAFMEINPRFQASTVLINKQLYKTKNKLSVQQLQIDAFFHPKCSYNISETEIKYSIFFYKYKKSILKKLKYHHSLISNDSKDVECFDDYLDWNSDIDENAYLYSIVINRNFSFINPDNNCCIDQNIDIYDSEIIDISSIQNNLIELKIMLLNQGTRISDSAMEYISTHGGLNYEEFQAIDLKIFEKYFNVPIMTRFTCISPFCIDINDNEYILNYYGSTLSRVELRSKNLLGKTIITNDLIADDITYLSNDRLRIFFRSGCFFKEHNIGCKFCDVENEKNIIAFKNIKTAIDLYLNCQKVNHYLIGGGSNNPNSNFKEIIEITKYLRSKNNKKISIMTTPPQNTAILKELKSAGVNEVVFNIEIFDRSVAENIMPGKGRIPLETYDLAFKEAIKIFGKSNVRSMLIICLEPFDSFLEGIEHLCSLGVYPTLSLFKPIEGTPMEKYIPPCNKDVLIIYNKTKLICKRNNVELGPNCRYCEDNTIKITD